MQTRCLSRTIAIRKSPRSTDSQNANIICLDFTAAVEAELIVFGADVLEKAGRKHADLRKSLGAWLKVVESSDWKSLADMRKTYPSADAVKEKYVFNLKGNRYGLVATINFEARHMFVDHVLTHADYSRGKWK